MNAVVHHAHRRAATAVLSVAVWLTGCDRTNDPTGADAAAPSTSAHPSPDASSSKNPSTRALSTRCDGGDLPACTELGDHHRDGQHVEVNAGRARWLYDKACSGGHAPACVREGKLYEWGIGVRADFGKAWTRYQRACEAKHQDGCGAAGHLLMTGRGRPSDVQNGVARMTKACNQGSAMTCDLLGWYWETGHYGLATNAIKAVSLFRKACDLDDGGGCTNLAFAYLRGSVVERDLSRSLTLNQKACDLGNGFACSNVAHAFHRGAGTKSDLARATTIYAKSCRQSVRRACNNLAVLAHEAPSAKEAADAARLFHAEVCSKSDAAVSCRMGDSMTEAVTHRIAEEKNMRRWQRDCASMPAQPAQPAQPALPAQPAQPAPPTLQAKPTQPSASPEGCFSLARAHEEGNFALLPNVREARKLFDKACAAGHGEACASVGLSLADGTMGSVDHTRAHERFTQACQLDSAAGCNHLGKAYELGTGVAVDTQRATQLFEKSCKLGGRKFLAGCHNLGVLLLSSEPKRGDRELQASCDRGHQLSCEHLANHLQWGTAVPQDRARATQLFGKLCGEGYARGCGELPPR